MKNRTELSECEVHGDSMEIQDLRVAYGLIRTSCEMPLVEGGVR